MTDYTDLPAAIRNEQVEQLRNLFQSATQGAQEHRQSAKRHQEAADREAHFADRDEERARQWGWLLACANNDMAPSVTRMLANISPEQRQGNACLICGGVITASEPDDRSAVINGVQFFTHSDAEVCTRVIAERLSEEVPF